MKTKSMILNVAAAALLSVAPFASAQQTESDGVATNLPGVTTSIAPPSGFNPLTASDGELATYGFPPRPDQNVSPGAFSAWERAMKASKERVFPVLELTSHFNGPNVGLGKTGVGTANSYNWSAVVDTTSAKSYGATSIYLAFTEFVIPVANQAFGSCTGGMDFSLSWVGIDGYGVSTDMLKAGTESDAYCIGGNKRAYLYSAWFEWYPFAEVRLPNLPVSPGDDMFVEVWSSSSTTGNAYLLNYNTNQYLEVGILAPPGTQLVGNSAEWVVERPSENGRLATLTNYISDYFSGAAAETVAGTVYYPGSSAAISLTMLDNSGNPISYPTLLGSYGIWFQDEGSARW